MIKRALIVTLAVAAVAVGVAWVPSAFRDGGALEGKIPSVRVERGEFVRRVYAEGNLEAAQSTKIQAPSGMRTGLKIAWLAPDGTHVEEGEVVVLLDPTEIEQKRIAGVNDRATVDKRIEQREVREAGDARNLERDADLALLELDYSREYEKKDPEVFSRVDIIIAEIDGKLATQKKEHFDSVRTIRNELSRVELDLLGIERRKADLLIDQADDDLQKLEIKAPHAGLFKLVDGWQGPPEVGSPVWSGQRIAEIPQLDTMEAKVFVLEADAGGLEPGVAALLTIDAHPGRVFSATIKKVDAMAQRRNRRVPVQYFGLTLEIDKTLPELMKPGQRVQATLIVDELEDVINVPRQAVFNDGERTIAYVRRKGKFRETEVKLGAAGLGRVVVEDGLSEGDVVALHDPTLPTGLSDDGGADGNGESASAAGANL